MSSQKLWKSVLIVFSLLTGVRCAQQSAVYQQADAQCAPEDSPIVRARILATATTPPATSCAIMASQTAQTGALVAQFRRGSRQCTIFQFQSICQHLMPGKTSGCYVYFRFPIDHGLLNAKLSNVWVGDRAGKLENLICQAHEDTNRLYPFNIQWSSEGSYFDGTTAYAVPNKSSLNFASGLTWLMKLKRQPQVQPILEFADCNDINGLTGYGIHLWEYAAPGQLYIRANRITGSLLPFVYSATDTLPLGQNDWLNIAFTANGSNFDVFVADSFLPRHTLSLYSDNNPNPITNSNACLYLGMRVEPANNPRFKGTMKALAFAGTSMSEAEIREFFSIFE